MKSVPTARRVSAIVALVAVVAVLAIVVLALTRHLLWLMAAIVCLGVAIGAAAYAVTRTGARRLVAAVVALVALVAPLALVVAYGRLPRPLFSIALVVIAGGRPDMRWAATSDRSRASPPPGWPWGRRPARSCS